MSSNNGTSSDPHIHEIKCIFCKKIIHACNDEDCKKHTTVHFPDKIKQAPIKVDMGLNPWTDGICEEEICQVKWMMKMWEMAFLTYTSEFNLEEAKVINSTFRILMLKPDKIEQLVKNGTLNAIVTPMEFVTARTFGWESMSPEAVQTMVEILAAALKRVSEIALKQNSKINIKKKLNDETAKKVADSKKAQAEPNKSAGRPTQTKWEKFLTAQKKIYPGVSDDQLLPHLAKLGYTPETVK